MRLEMLELDEPVCLSAAFDNYQHDHRKTTTNHHNERDIDVAEVFPSPPRG